MAKILIVDDRAINRQFLITLLGYGGHQLLEARDGVEALTAVRNEHPDLVVCDVLMPTMDGYEFVRQLRSIPQIHLTKVIFYTAHYLQPDAQRLAAECGVLHILTKPAKPDAVLRVVDEALAAHAPVVTMPHANEFDREHLRLVTDKLSQNAEDLRAANERLAALIGLNLELTAERDPEVLLGQVCEGARQLIGARYSILAIKSDASEDVARLFNSGFPAGSAMEPGLPRIDQGTLGTVLRNCRTLRMDQGASDPAQLGLPASYPAFQTLLAAPVTSHISVYGWICLTDKLDADQFGIEDEQLLAVVGAQLGRVYENSSLYSRVRRYAAQLEVEIGERKRAEEALGAERVLLRTLIDALPDPIFTKDTAGRFVIGNPAILRELRLTRQEELAGKTVFDFFPPKLAELYHADDLHVLAGEAVLNREDQSLDASGHYEWHSNTRVPLRALDGNIIGLVGMTRNLTEHKRGEELQRRAQKMEALGTLASGIAHDFNNVLLAIAGNTNLAIQDLDADHPARESLVEVDKASARAADLVRRILHFTRQDDVQRDVLQVEQVVEEVLKLLRPILPPMIEIRTRLAPHLPAIAANSTQLHQVLVNLLNNSAHAIGAAQGLIEVALEEAHLDAESAPMIAELHASRYVRLSVSDTGCGMDQATMERIFDPFFTTKAMGVGTGLGLYAVHGIVRSHGGAITVFSEPGKGTEFRLYFPAAAGKAATIEAPRHEVSPGHGAHVLYVDDDQALVHLSVRALSRVGYEVTGVNDAAEALRVFEREPEKFDIVVTDLAMPGMSGFDLAQHILAIRPDQPVVMVSGYILPEDQERAAHMGIRQVILKPASFEELARTLHQALDDAQTDSQNS